MKALLSINRFSLVQFLLFLLALKSVLSVTYYLCDEEDKINDDPINVCGFSIISIDKQIRPLNDFSSVSNACKTSLVTFAIEGQCDEFK